MKNFSGSRLLVSDFTIHGIIDIKALFLDVKIKETKKRVKFFDNTKIMLIDKLFKVYIFDFAQNMKVLNLSDFKIYF